MDGDTRGGVALSVRHLTNVPIKFIGVSEKLDGLTEFHPDRMASRIIGMGDILSIVEKVESEINEKEAMDTYKKMTKGTFDLKEIKERKGEKRNDAESDIAIFVCRNDYRPEQRRQEPSEDSPVSDENVCCDAPA